MTERQDNALVHRVRPPRAPSAGRPPALILLHGRGADEQDLLSLADVLDARLFAIAARAPYPLGRGWHWYDLARVGEPEPRMFTASLATLEHFVAQVVADYNLDPKRIFLLGFSQGAVMSGALLLSHPERFGAAVLLSGYLPRTSGLTIATAGMAGKPVFIGHGTGDQVIPVSFGREAAAALRRMDADVTAREYPIDHRIAAGELDAIAVWLRARIDAPASDSGGMESALTRATIAPEE